MEKSREITVSDRMQSDYTYTLVAPVGEDFALDFKPRFSPAEMLRLGVFEGKYLTDCALKFPAAWFEGAKLSQTSDPDVNYFGVKSRQPLGVGREKGWIYGPDARGWFQWYCRYYQGRRLTEIDRIQIGRWKGFARHAGQVRANCYPGDIFLQTTAASGVAAMVARPLHLRRFGVTFRGKRQCQAGNPSRGSAMRTERENQCENGVFSSPGVPFAQHPRASSTLACESCFSGSGGS